MKRSAYEVLVADSHPLCREGLSNLLRKTLGVAVIYQVSSFPAALAALTSSPAIGVASFDIELPGLRRAEGLREVRLRFPLLRVAAASASADKAVVLDTLASGAHGCIPKDLPVSEIADAFRTIAAGQIYVPSVMSEIEAAPPQAEAVSALAGRQLTDRQLEVLTLMAAGRSNKEIARLLCIAEGTVKVHVAAAFKLLKVHNRVSAVAAMQSLANRREPSLSMFPGLFDDRGGMPQRRRGDLAVADMSMHVQ